MKLPLRPILAALTVAVLGVGPAVMPVGPSVLSASASTVSVGAAPCVQAVSSSNGVVVTNPTISGVHYCVIQFTEAGAKDWTVPAGVTSVDYLIVGAGGAGSPGGGGGAGGLLTGANFSVIAGASQTITVGAGGVGTKQNGINDPNSFGGDGGSSLAFGLTAFGGGGGGASFRGDDAVTVNGRAGGSGGGAGAVEVARSGGAGTDGQGFSGGANDPSKYTSGGGGGAGGAGGNASTTSGGAAGVGSTSNLSGLVIGFAGGGAGSFFSSSFAANPGTSATLFGGGTAASSGNTAAGNGGHGTDGQGGGGGGAHYNQTGGTGGSGLVTVRYAVATGSSSPGIRPVGVDAQPGAAFLNFESDSSTDNADISSWEIDYSANKGLTWTSVANPVTGDFTLSGLTAGTTYVVRISAANAIGPKISPTYWEVTPSSANTAPGQVTGLLVTPGSGSVALTWSAPGNGGSAITDYIIERSTDGTNWTPVVDGENTSTSYTVTGLTNGTAYQFRVAAKNVVGTGSYSTTSSGTPVSGSTVPNQVTGLTVSAGVGQANLTWTAPADGGAPISDYAIEISTDGVTWTQVADGTSSLTSYTVTGLTPGSSYRFRVAAINSVGTGPASTASAAQTIGGGSGSSENGGTSSSNPRAVSTPSVVPVVQPRRFPFIPNTAPVIEPVERPGLRFDPNAPVRGSVGGAPMSVTKVPEGSTGVSVTVGAFQFGVNLREPSGEALNLDTPSRSPELQISRGQMASVAGGGSYPGSFVQLWLPGKGTDSRELARIPVGPDGTFVSDLTFGTGPLELPLPIGRQVLQVVGYDGRGNQTVVDMTINIGQGVPSPEPNRQLGELPALSAGQSVATSGGFPEMVAVTRAPGTGSVVVEGLGWSVNVSEDETNSLGGNTDGELLVRLKQSSVRTAEGVGFLPGTLASVWLFSEPTLVATVTVDDNGEFSAEFLVDGSVIPPGEHTLQIQGVGTDGFIKAANLGVIVEAPVTLTTDSASGLLWWALGFFLVALGVSFALVLLRRRRQDA